MEHHSNIIPWQLICEKTGASLKYIPICEDGTLDLSNSDTYFTEKTKIDCVIHLAAQAGVRYSIENPQAYIDSNICGFINILGIP